MFDDSIKDGLQNLYARNSDEFRRQARSMQQPGEWGEDCQIAAAAHLFQLSILYFSQYGQSGQYRIQHFPPHFSYQQDCTTNCHHETLYLINSGSHYDPATVLNYHE